MGRRPGPAQPAFVYRNTAENERQNGPAARPGATGVRLPEYSGKRTPVRGEAGPARSEPTGVPHRGLRAVRNGGSGRGGRRA